MPASKEVLHDASGMHDVEKRGVRKVRVIKSNRRIIERERARVGERTGRARINSLSAVCRE